MPRYLVSCANCGTDVATDKKAPVLCYECWREKYGPKGLSIDDAVREIRKVYGCAPRAGTAELYNILKAFQRTSQ